MKIPCTLYRLLSEGQMVHTTSRSSRSQEMARTCRSALLRNESQRLLFRPHCAHTIADSILSCSPSWESHASEPAVIQLTMLTPELYMRGISPLQSSCLHSTALATAMHEVCVRENYQPWMKDDDCKVTRLSILPNTICRAIIRRSPGHIPRIPSYASSLAVYKSLDGPEGFCRSTLSRENIITALSQKYRNRLSIQRDTFTSQSISRYRRDTPEWLAIM